MLIVPVKVNAKGQDKKVLTCAFLDTGSNTSFCTEDLLKKLNAEGEKATLSLTTMGKSNETIECSLVNLEVSDIGNQNLIELPMVYSRPSLPVSTSAIDPGGGDSHIKQTGMLVVSLRGVNFGFWSRLGCSGQSANILSREGLV